MKAKETTVFFSSLTLLVKAVDKAIKENDYSGELDLSNAKDWSRKDKLNWVRKKFIQEMDQTLTVPNVVFWLQGLALDIPYWDDDIKELGFDSDTYWEDVAGVIVG